MGIALQKRVIAGLSGIFILAALGTHEAEAAPRHHKPHQTVKSAKPKYAAVNNDCVQTASASFAEAQGYRNARDMRGTGALAYLRTKEGLDNTLLSAIALASREVGADFNLMVMVATIESRLGEYDAPIMGSSSAKGPFQYLPAPFLTLFSWFGADYAGGVYARAAAQIKFDENKNPYTDDPRLAEEILKLRSDPYVASYIKAVEIEKDVRPLLHAVLGRQPVSSDIYIAHFFGLENEKTLIRGVRHTPKSFAADIFVKESSAADNRPLFYRGNKKLTMRQVFTNLSSLANRVLGRIDKKIAVGLSASCVPPLALERPVPPLIVVPDRVIPPVIPPPPKPTETPIEPDALKAPIPVPVPVPPTPEPTSGPQPLRKNFDHH